MTDKTIETLRNLFESATGKPHQARTYNDKGGVNHFSENYVEWVESRSESLETERGKLEVVNAFYLEGLEKSDERIKSLETELAEVKGEREKLMLKITDLEMEAKAGNIPYRDAVKMQKFIEGIKNYPDSYPVHALRQLAREALKGKE